MDVTPQVSADAKIIQSYSDKGFRVSGEVYNQAILVKPNDLFEVDVPHFSALSFSALNGIMTGVDVLIIGTGAEQQFLPKEIKADFRAQNISTETMTSGAACRTYNVLMTEGRQIAVLLFLK